MARDVTDRRAADRRRPRHRGRAVDLPARLRPHRRARRAGPHPGARRRRRPPARLGAADPGADPEERRRRRHRRPAGPGPGARPAVLAVRRRVHRREHRRQRPARGRGRGRGRRTASPSRSSPSATAPLDETLRPARRTPRARRSPTPPSTPGTGQVDVYAEVSPAAVDVFVRDRGRGFDPEQVAEDRHGVRHSIIDRMERHGGTAESGRRRARAPRCGCTCPRQEETHD